MINRPILEQVTCPHCNVSYIAVPGESSSWCLNCNHLLDAMDCAKLNLTRRLTTKEITIEKNISGFLEIGTNDNNEIVVNHHDLDIDENGQGFICFSISEAEALVRILNKKIKYLRTGIE